MGEEKSATLIILPYTRNLHKIFYQSQPFQINIFFPNLIKTNK